MDETTTSPGEQAERPPFGALLRRLRRAAGLSQEALAERARLSVEAISALERGARRAPQRQTLTLLADALALDARSRAGLADAARRSAPPRLPAEHPAARGALPLALTPFHGRDNELARLLDAVARYRLVTVWGPPGVGKTRLALEAARVAAERFPDGVCFVDLGAVDDPQRVTVAVADAAGVHEAPDRALEETLALALASRRALLVLDTCEHLLEPCGALVTALLARAATLSVVVTSREPLSLPGEVVQRLDPLPLPVAEELFLERVASAGGAAPDAGELRAVGTLCAKLDGLPLALELAAARARAMSVTQIAAALDERFRLLSRGMRTAALRQQTLRATVDWSHRLLSDRERLVFRRLGVLPGEWSVEDAAAVAGPEHEPWAVADAVHALVDRALVVATGGGEPRFRTLDTLRAYALERLHDAGELDAVERRNAQHWVTLAGGFQEAWRDDDVETLAEFAPRAPAADAALDWAVTRGRDAALGALLAGRLSACWDVTGRHVDGLRRLDAALARLDPAADTATAVEAWNGVARLARRLELHDRALGAAVRAAELAETLADRPDLRAWTSLNRAQNEFNVGSPEAGARALAAATSLFRRLGNEAGIRAATTSAASAALEQGRFAEAREGLRDGVRFAKARPASRLFVLHLLSLGEAEYGCGDPVAALACVDEALAGARALGGEQITCCALLNRAGYLLGAGDRAAARVAAHEALLLATESRYGVLQAFALQYHASLGARGGDARAAAELLGYADRVVAESGTRRGFTEETDAQRTRELLRDALGEPELAAALHDGAALGEAEAIARASATF